MTIGPGADDPQLASGSGGQHQQTHDALSVDGLAILLDEHISGELTRQLHEGSGRTRMDPLTVLDRDIAIEGVFFASLGGRTHCSRVFRRCTDANPEISNARVSRAAIQGVADLSRWA